MAIDPKVKEQQLVTTVYPRVVDLFSSQKMQNQLMTALPSVPGLSVNRMVRVTLTLLRTNPKLLECSQQSLLACLMGSAQLGLTPEPYLGHVYFVPYWSSKLNSFESQLIPGYRGYVTLARRSGDVKNITAQAVYERDEFEFEYGTNQHLRHKPVFSDRGKFIGAYTMFHYNEFDPSFDFMTEEEIEKIKSRTKSRDRQGNIVGPWVSDYEQMAVKTVIRRHIKIAPLSIEDKLSLAAHAENIAIDGGSQSTLFLPDIDSPLEVNSPKEEVAPATLTDKDKVHHFNNHLQASGYLGDVRLDRFLTITAESSKKTIDDIKAMAWDEKDRFFAAFERWAKTQTKEGGAGEKQAVFDRPYTARPDPMQRPEPNREYPPETEAPPMSGEESEDDSDGPDEDKVTLYESDEWNELSAMAQQFPKEYKEHITGKYKLNTVRSISAAIVKLNKIVGEDIPM